MGIRVNVNSGDHLDLLNQGQQPDLDVGIVNPSHKPRSDDIQMVCVRVDYPRKNVFAADITIKRKPAEVGTDRLSTIIPDKPLDGKALEMTDGHSHRTFPCDNVIQQHNPQRLAA